MTILIGEYLPTNIRKNYIVRKIFTVNNALYSCYLTFTASFYSLDVVNLRQSPKQRYGYKHECEHSQTQADTQGFDRGISSDYES